jgi:hypothetical protein
MNKDKLKEMMNDRNPLSPDRVVVQPANLYGEKKPVAQATNQTTEQVKTPQVHKEPVGKDNKRSKRSTEPNDRTVKANGTTERSSTPNESTSVLDELKVGVVDDKRPTERYSFEIFTDQKAKVEELQYQYKKKTGKRLSSSRIIREALEEYLTKALEALR